MGDCSCVTWSFWNVLRLYLAVGGSVILAGAWPRPHFREIGMGMSLNASLMQLANSVQPAKFAKRLWIASRQRTSNLDKSYSMAALERSLLKIGVSMPFQLVVRQVCWHSKELDNSPKCKRAATAHLRVWNRVHTFRAKTLLDAFRQG